MTNHQAPAALPKPAPEPAKPVAAAPKAPTTRVFTTRPIRYRDQDGKQVSTGKCVDHDLPTALVERALATGAVVRLDNAMRAGNLGRWSHYSLAACFDIDAEPVPGPQEAVLHSAFTPIDRGKPFTLKIAGAAQ